MAPRKKAADKAQERADLKEIRSITITVKASDFNLQRLAAFMIFCEHLEPVVEVGPEKPMPWEDPSDPRFNGPTLEIDYEVVRRDITKHLAAFVAAWGEEPARNILRSFGGERLSQVPEAQLLSLRNALAEPNEKV